MKKIKKDSDLLFIDWFDEDESGFDTWIAGLCINLIKSKLK